MCRICNRNLILEYATEFVYRACGTHVGKNIINNPTRALQIANQLRAAATKISKAIMNAGMQAGQFSVSGRGAVKTGELTTGGFLYLFKK